jgi:phospholipid transport system substrate-binding protein
VKFERKLGLIVSALILCILALAACPQATFSDDSKPVATIAKFNNALLEAMKRADQLGYQGRFKILEPVIKDVFALSFMGIKSMGRYWKKLTPAQQDLYMKTYTTWTIATYAGRFDGYSGEKFEVSKSSPVDAETVAVKSSMLKSDGERIVDFKYLMRRISGRWQIVDIRIVEVSQLALTRAQFVSVMSKDGFNSLINMLKEKTGAFAGKHKGEK